MSIVVKYVCLVGRCNSSFLFIPYLNAAYTNILSIRRINQVNTTKLQHVSNVLFNVNAAVLTVVAFSLAFILLFC